MTLWWLVAALAWPELGPDGVPTGATVDAHARFSRASLPNKPIVVDPALSAVADSALQWLTSAPDEAASTAGALSDLGYTIGDTTAVLRLLVSAGNAAMVTGHNPLTDRAFVDANLQLLSWRPDRTAAAAHNVAVTDKIRLTRYLVYEVDGRMAPDETFNTALYGAPSEETGDRLRYTRQDVLRGVYEPGGEAEGHAPPLAWVTRESLFRGLMQGSVQVNLPDGSSMLFNVDVNNNIPYNRDEHDSSKQARYWYFREVPGLRGYTTPGRPPIDIAPRATVAGDVYNLGLGRVVLLDVGAELWLTVLADTGGAFQPNLYQLDWLSGVYPSYEAYQRATANVPERVAASLLVPHHAVEGL